MEIEATVPATSVEIGSKSGHHGWHERGWNEQMAVGFTASALASANTDLESQENFGSVSKQVSDAATATVVGFKDQAATSYQIEGRSLLEAAKNANAVAVQNTNNFNLVQIEAVKNAAAAALEATKNAAAAYLQGSQSTAAILAAQAECCCELKELIREDGDKTRALINDNEIQRLRSQLVATQRLIAVNIPVGA